VQFEFRNQGVICGFEWDGGKRLTDVISWDWDPKDLSLWLHEKMEQLKPPLNVCMAEISVLPIILGGAEAFTAEATVCSQLRPIRTINALL
jgi:hypothetical protein